MTVLELAARLVTEIDRALRDPDYMVAVMAARLILQAEDYLKREAS